MKPLFELKEFVTLRLAYAEKRLEAERLNADEDCAEYWKGERHAYAAVLEKLQ